MADVEGLKSLESDISSSEEKVGTLVADGRVFEALMSASIAVAEEHSRPAVELGVGFTVSR